jgi:hypothetical protein
MRITNRTKDVDLCRDAAVARTFWSRLVGLMGRKSLEAGGGLVIEPCRSVHTMFMRFPIDVVYVDRSDGVVGTVPGLKPFRASLGKKGAHRVIELPAGTLAQSGTAEGDVLVFDSQAG